MAYGSIIEPRKLVVREFAIKDDSLPRMKVVLLSDIHVGPFKKREWVQRLVDRINTLEDIEAVFIAGDFIYG